MIQINVVILMLSYLSTPQGTVMGHSTYKTLTECEQAIVNMKKQEPNAVGACILATSK